MTRTTPAGRGHRVRALGLAAALAAGVATAATAPAAADSIAYVKAGDVWLSTADGARQFRVTATGGYTDVTQADDGTMIGLHGVRLRRLGRTGAVLADFDTPVSDTRPEGQRVFYGPFDPAVSPNGRRLSYTYYYVGKGSAPGCAPPTCTTTVTEGGTGYSHADRQTAWDEPGLGRHSGWRNATWLDDDTTMISDPTHLPNPDVLLDPVGDGRPGDDGLTQDWFSDDGTPHLGAGEMTRQRDKVAFQAGQGDDAMRIYRMTAFYPALPEACYAYGVSGDGTVGAPTWSPTGTRLAWAEGDGVRVVDVPSLAAGCELDGASPTSALLIPGATQPDWGPADVPAGAGAGGAGFDGGGTEAGGTGGTRIGGTSGAGGTGGTGGTGAVGATGPSTAKKVTVRVASASVRSGVRLRVALPGKGRVAGVATAGGTTIASAGSRTVRRAGTVVLTLRITATGRRALARVRSRRVTVAVTFRAPGASPVVARRTKVAVRGGRR